VREPHHADADSEIHSLDQRLPLYFAYYNFCRLHSSIRVTPAMEAKITDHVWDLAELLA